MRIGLKPIIYEQDLLGGRFLATKFENGPGNAFAEMGAMRFPLAATALFYYVNLLNLTTEPFPNPLTEAAGSTLIDLLGQQYYVEGTDSVPDMFKDLALKWNDAIEEYFNFTNMQTAIKENDVVAIKAIWNNYVTDYDDVSFRRFLVNAGFSFDEIYTFGKVGFGSGGWDTDYPNSILEILRVVYTNADDNHMRITEGTSSFVERLWELEPEDISHWPAGTSIKSLNEGAPMGEVIAISSGTNSVTITTKENTTNYESVVITPEKRVLQSGAIVLDSNLLGSTVLEAIHSTHYELSGKVFSTANTPIWNEKDTQTGRYKMSMTLSDRLTRGTYLFTDSGGAPVICLSYTWNDDTLKFLPFSTDARTQRSALVLKELYPAVDFDNLLTGIPLSIVWDALPHFIGAFKTNLPGDYRYQRTLFTAFKEDSVSISNGVFLAGDDISWTGGWSEGAIHTALNAVWGVINHLGGASFPGNLGPGDSGYENYAPIKLPNMIQS